VHYVVLLLLFALFSILFNVMYLCKCSVQYVVLLLLFALFAIIFIFNVAVCIFCAVHCVVIIIILIAILFTVM